MSLEYLVSKTGLFVTLTYADENLPYAPSGRSSLCKKDFQDFMKRLRKELHPHKIRYFACGEYGSKTERPHYHAIIFGIDESFSELVASKWPHGMVACGTCTADSIQYVAGYCLKKLVDVRKGDERVPEFILTSRNPGLGVPAIEYISQGLKEHPELFKIGDFADDVPGSLVVLGKNLPLGRFMVSKLRQAMGTDPDRENMDWIESLRGKWLETEPSFFDRDFVAQADYDFFGPLASALMSEDAQRAKVMEGRLKIFNKRDTI